MIYFDFDGVILDTEELLFEEWRKIPNHHDLSEEEKIKYIQAANWDFIINNSQIINDSIYYLNQMDPTKTAILTKIHSMGNEGNAKVKWLRSMNIKQTIIPVPYMLKKTDLVDARGNILVDDCLANLYDWEDNNGQPILFDIDDDNYDSWHKPNVKGYQKVLSLSRFNK